MAIPKNFSNEQDKLDVTKNEVAQLNFLLNIVSPIDFEQKIKLSELVMEKQKLVNEINFKIFESKLKSANIFEDLFEQSFLEIQKSYTGIFASENDSIDFFAPDGTRSKLSPEINELIRTPEFIEWFGNYLLAFIYKEDNIIDFNCSRVLDRNFEPLIVWHGTGQEFSYFKFDTFPAAYFAVKREYSQWFAELHGGDEGYTIPFFLNIRNPLNLTHFSTRKVSTKDFFDFMYLTTGMNMEQLEVNPIFMDSTFPDQQIWVYIRNNPKMLKKIAKTNLYDGIRFFETNPNLDPSSSNFDTEAFIIFDSSQAKIADPKRGLLVMSSLKSFLLKRGGKI